MINSNLETMDQKLDRLMGIVEHLLRVSQEQITAMTQIIDHMAVLETRINLKEALPPRPDDEYLNFQEIARRAGVTPAAVTNWRIRHDDFPLPAKEIGKTKLFSARQISRWLQARQNNQPKAVTQMQSS